MTYSKKSTQSLMNVIKITSEVTEVISSCLIDAATKSDTNELSDFIYGRIHSAYDHSNEYDSETELNQCYDNGFSSGNTTPVINRTDELGSHKWVEYFTQHDPINEEFSMNSLIIVRGDAKKLKLLSQNDLIVMDSEKVQEIIKSIDLVQRNSLCQMYLIQGLQNSVHFSLGKNGSSKLMEFFHKRGVSLNYYRNYDSYKSCSKKFVQRKDNPNTPYMITYVENPRKTGLSDLESQYIELMTDVGNELFPIFFGVSKSC